MSLKDFFFGRTASRPGRSSLGQPVGATLKRLGERNETSSAALREEIIGPLGILFCIVFVAAAVFILDYGVLPPLQKMESRPLADIHARVDFRYNDAAGEDGELVLLEINTQPGMTEVSLAPEQAAHAGHSYSELCAWLVEDASCNR